MPTLALVAVSARMMAEAAVRDGFQALAVDLFGDQDTRRASTDWRPGGDPATLQLDDTAVLDALRTYARRGDVAGWVPGGGTEGRPELLAEGARILPLIGTAPAAVARVRDPLAFFGFLAAHGIGHPEVRSSAPPDVAGWLLKDMRGCGGWHIRPARPDEAPAPQQYLQRVAAGRPMSATYVANGSQACLLGCNELIVKPQRGGERPYVYCGAIGPVALPPQAAQQLGRALRLLAGGFVLQGLGSIDFLLDADGQLQLLEVNPRPPATLALYRGSLAAHVNACLHGALPEAPSTHAVSGHEVVWAPQALVLDAATAARLATWPGCHDLPAAGARFAAGDPLCTLSASGADAAAVRGALDGARAALLQSLSETP
jgi:uncharacterized protein